VTGFLDHIGFPREVENSTCLRGLNWDGQNYADFRYWCEVFRDWFDRRKLHSRLVSTIAGLIKMLVVVAMKEPTERIVSESLHHGTVGLQQLNRLALL